MRVNVLAFDYGKRFIGVAVGQPLCGVRALPCVYATKGVPRWEMITQLVKDWEPYVFVVGYPLNMDGSKQRLTRAVEVFSRELEKRYKLPCHWVDERLTTYQAKLELQARSRHYKKSDLDSYSATIILQQWFLDNEGNNSEKS